MADIQLVSSGSDTITVSGRTVDQLIRAGSGDAALLYLYVLRTGGSASAAGAAKALGKTQRDIAASMELLKSLGLLSFGEQSPAPAGGHTPAAAPVPPARLQREEMPDYAVEDIKRELENGSVFNALVQEVQKTLGKILSSDDLIKLFGIYDCVGLPPEVILMLVTYCLDENKRRYGPGRVPTLRYIEKAAFTWEREGVVTLEAAERYIKMMETKRSLIGEIKRILQIRDRELTADERRYIDGWLAGGFTPDVIELAYERTILGTGYLAWKYMNSILNSWQQKGLRTLKEIEAKDVKSGAAPEKRQARPAKPSAPTAADIEHMKKFLERLREE